MQPFEVTGRRLGTAALLYLTMTVAVITLAPFQFVPTPVNELATRWNPFDLVMNVVMFVPLGFVYALSRSRARPSTEVAWRGAVVLGAALSAVVEAAQVFAPTRFPSLFDLATNTAGAGIGAWLAGLAVLRANATETMRTLSVDLPLMGLVYFMVPLAWLVTLGSENEGRIWVIAPLAVSASWTISSVFTSFEQASRSRVLGVTGAWLAIALLPSAVRAPLVSLVIATLGLIAAWARTSAPPWLTHEAYSGRQARRFETATLRLVVPLFCMYVVTTSLTPFETPTTWAGAIGIAPRGERVRDAEVFRALEQLGALTLVGYAIAEYHGRSREALAAVARPVLVWGAPIAIGVQWLRGWHPAYGASGIVLALTLAGTLWGAWLYVLQLQHVQALGARSA
jgi:VanZ family protein